MLGFIYFLLVLSIRFFSIIIPYELGRMYVEHKPPAVFLVCFYTKKSAKFCVFFKFQNVEHKRTFMNVVLAVAAVVPFRQNLLWRKIWMAAQVAAVQPAPVPAVLCAFINLGNKKRPNGRFLLQEFHTRLCHFCNTFC